jgi:microcystin-dependent protein
MSNPFVAEIRIFAGNFAPRGWAQCNGQIMPISQNTALFSLLGTTYGGDGKTNFALPNLQGCAPMQQGQGPGLSLRDLGELGGEPTVTLLQSEIPAHPLVVQAATGGGGSSAPANNAWASGAKGLGDLYSPSNNPTNVQMSPIAVSTAGGSLPHNNMMPYLGLTFIIALQGVFPPRG